MDEATRLALGITVGAAVRRATVTGGGFTTSRTWTLELDDGRRVFAKVAADGEGVAGNRTEAVVLAALTSRHAPSFVACSDDGRVLVAEDLSDADWQPHLGPLDGLWDAIAELGARPGPSELAASYQGRDRDPWTAVLADERFAPAVDLDRAWLTELAPALSGAARDADTSGDWLVHGDLAPGNWCRRPDGAWAFVDWTAAHRGNPLVDDAIAAIRVTRLLGRPAASVRLARHPEIAALVAGRFAGELLDVDWSAAPAVAREERVADIRAGILLTSHLLERTPPPG